MKTLIAIPCMDMLPVGFVQSLMYMHKGDNPTVYFKPNSLVCDSRNLLSLYAIENGFDNVLWLDSDMLFPPNTLTKLEAYNMDMVTGLYVKRHEPVEPVLYEKIEEPERGNDGKLIANIASYTNYHRDSFFPVAGCGFGCVLIDVQIMREVMQKDGTCFLPMPHYGEDLAFCIRVAALGYKMYAEPSAVCGHIGHTVIYPEDHERWKQTISF